MLSLLKFINKNLHITKSSLIPLNTVIKTKALDRKTSRDLHLNKNDGFTFFVDNNNNVVKAKDISEIKPLLLQQPVDYPKKNLISGFMSLSIKEKTSLDSSMELELNMIIITKILHLNYCFKTDASDNNDDFNNFHTKIYNCFKGFKFPFSVTKSKMIFNFQSDKMIVLSQHLLNITAPNNIPFHILYKKGKSCGIRTDSYANEATTRIGPHIEIIFVNEVIVILKNNTSKPIEVHLVNAENIIGVNENFSPVISEEQTGQKHADVLFKFLLEKLKLYYDAKTFSAVGVSHRRLSLFQPSKKKLQDFINDVQCSFKSYLIKNNIAYDHEFWKLYKNVVDIINTKKTEEVKYDNIIGYLCKIAFDPKYEELPICLALPVAEDNAFNKILANIPREILEEVARRSKNEIQIIMDQTSTQDAKETALCVLENLLRESLPPDIVPEFFAKAITL